MRQERIITVAYEEQQGKNNNRGKKHVFSKQAAEAYTSWSEAMEGGRKKEKSNYDVRKLEVKTSEEKHFN